MESSIPMSLILDWQNSWTQYRATSPPQSWAHLDMWLHKMLMLECYIRRVMFTVLMF
ncbi:hypothetical protein P3S67_007707 [Capsicum chacoense]